MGVTRTSLMLALAASMTAAAPLASAQPPPATPPAAPADGAQSKAPKQPRRARSSGVPELDRQEALFHEHNDARRYEQALAAARRCSSLAQRHFGRDHATVATWLNNAAAAHFALRQYGEARELLERSLKISAKRRSPDDPETGLDSFNLAKLHLVEGDHAGAMPLLERAARIIEKAQGPEGPFLSTVLYGRGDAHRAAKRFGQAKADYERSLAIRSKVFGRDDLLVAELRHALAGLAQTMGNQGAARSHYQEAVRIEEAKLGPDDLRLAVSLNALALAHEALGEYRQAEKLLRRAIRIDEKHLGAGHLETAALESNLGSVLLSLGAFAEAQALLEHAVSTLRAQQRPNLHSLTQAAQNLAMAHRYRGDLVRAATELQQVIELQQKHFGSDHPSLALTLGNLAEVELERRNADRAVPLLRRALAIREKAFGADHPVTAGTLHNLASALSYGGHDVEALAMTERVVATWSRALGAQHPKVAAALNNLAQIEEATGRDEAARKHYEQALRIFDERGLDTVPARAQVLENLAILHASNGRAKSAVQTLGDANAVRERMVAALLGRGSEQQKLALVKRQAVRTSFAVGIHLHAAPENAQAAELALTTVLRRKGQVLDAMSQSQQLLRQRLEAEDRKLFDRLAGVRAQLAAIVFGGQAIDAEQLAGLQQQADRLERAMSARSAEFAVERQPIDIAQVQAMLPADGALVEIVRYTVPIGLEAAKPHQGSRDRYAAYVLGPSGPPQWVALGPAGPIDEEVDRVRGALADRTRWEVKRLARLLDQRVMAPIRPLLGNAQQVIIAPDGKLNLLPFEALVDEQDRYLLQRYAVSYLTSGRDLVRLALDLPSRSPPAVIAAPSFGQRGPKAPPGSDAPDGSEPNVRAPVRMKFIPLPETAVEAQSISEILPEAVLLTEARATKKALKKLRGPKVLHLATHGFFVGAAEPEAGSSAGGLRGLKLTSAAPTRTALGDVDHPLLRSGLALAGANELQGKRSTGVLTALEASGLDLRGTRLVVMSACETGLGEVEGGEGVFGLRRALVMAGAQTQVMSLWNVDDEATRRLMVGFYRNLAAGKGRREALRQEQLAMLQNESTAHPHYWAAFIVSGAWGPLDRNAAKPPAVDPSARGCACRLSTGSQPGGGELGLAGLLAYAAALAVRRRRRPR